MRLPDKIHLHLGCGANHLAGYVNIDLSGKSVVASNADLDADVTTLDYPPQSIDEVRSHHLFEHFSRPVALAQLIKWHEWLKVDGTLIIEVPDVMGCAKQLADPNTDYLVRQVLVRHLFGSHEAEWAYHRDGWYAERFQRILSQFGFQTHCRTNQPAVGSYLASVTVTATKLKHLDHDLLLEAADAILQESMVDDIPQEQAMYEIWRKGMRANLSSVPDPPILARSQLLLGVVFSKDRALQLDATLRSFDLHCLDRENVDVKVLFTTSTDQHERQYHQLEDEHQEVEFFREEAFKADLISMLSTYRYVLFLVDDNIFIRDFKLNDAMSMLEEERDALGFSLRLGRNTTYSFMQNRSQALPTFSPRGSALAFDWREGEGDFGYPLEVSSSLYRVSDVLPLLGQQVFRNPNSLEVILQTSGFRETHPYLCCYEQSVTFCNPINTVQTMWQNRAGSQGDYTPDALARRFAGGDRIDVASYSGFVPNGCHQLVDLHLKYGGEVTSIIILNLNGEPHVRACIESLRACTHEPYELIVVDNGSTDGSLDYLKTVPGITLIANQVNVGAPGGRNQALAYAQGEFVVCVDNDVVFTNDWLTRFIEHARKRPDVGLIGPRSNYVSGPQLVNDAAYTNYQELQFYAHNRAIGHQELLPIERLVLFCLFMRREVIRQIGGFDTQFSPWGFEDDDYCIRAQVAGWKLGVANDVYIHHEGSKTAQTGNIDYAALLKRNWDVFRKKWKIDWTPGQPMGYNVGQILERDRMPA